MNDNSGTDKLQEHAHASDSLPVQSACKKSACAIQWCLVKNNHQQDRCQAYITAWEDCVSKVLALQDVSKVKWWLNFFIAFPHLYSGRSADKMGLEIVKTTSRENFSPIVGMLSILDVTSILFHPLVQNRRDSHKP